MRILFYCRKGYRLFNPKSFILFGGAEVELYNLAMAMAKDPRYEVYFLCEKESGFPYLETISNVKVIRIKPITRGEIFFKPYYFIQLLLETLTLLRRIRPDIIFQATAAFETGLLWALKTSSLFVYRIENDWDVNKDYRKMKPFFISRVYELGLRHADAIIAQTFYQKNLLKENYCREAYVIPNAQPVPSKDVIIPFSGRQYFLWVARLTTTKRPEIFLELAERYPSREFVMIAAYNKANEFIDSILSRAANLPNLRLYISLPWSEVASFYSKALALVITFIPESEGYPNVMLEAMKYGTPIYSLEWNRDSVITDNNLGMVFGGDKEAFIKALGPFVEDESQWNTYSENAHNYSLTRHDIKNIKASYDQLFESLYYQNRFGKKS
ncbi:MAG: glycosyltransferase family 4 protein [Syntrophobacterales bacterium]|nr:glycosyltransferase family 4 protein [Syntrophobacterales bacterium]